MLTILLLFEEPQKCIVLASSSFQEQDFYGIQASQYRSLKQFVSINLQTLPPLKFSLTGGSKHFQC